MNREFYEKLTKEELIKVIGNLLLRNSKLEEDNIILKERKDTVREIKVIQRIIPLDEYIKDNPRREEICSILSNPDNYRLSENDIQFLTGIVEKVGLSAKQSSWLEGIKTRGK